MAPLQGIQSMGAIEWCIKRTWGVRLYGVLKLLLCYDAVMLAHTSCSWGSTYKQHTTVQQKVEALQDLVPHSSAFAQTKVQLPHTRDCLKPGWTFTSALPVVALGCECIALVFEEGRLPLRHIQAVSLHSNSINTALDENLTRTWECMSESFLNYSQ
jgi:hypothetical protein